MVSLMQVKQADSHLELSNALEQLVSITRIRPIDRAFADFVYTEETSHEPAARACLSLLAAHVSAMSGEQHSCVDLTSLGQPFLGVFEFPPRQLLLDYLHSANSVTVIEETEFKDVQQVNTPLVVQNAKLYMQRYWQYEVRLANMIKEKSKQSLPLDIATAKPLIDNLFTQTDSQTLDWQKVAVCIAASQKLSFVTGGPGTGKTTTVAKLLALLQGLAGKQAKVLTIQLVAPTGKAAARLTESLNSAKQKLPSELQAGLPEQCQTIHRLLGAKPQSPYFKANAEHPLHLDVLVLDEASMVDLPLMTKLFDALPKEAHVVLLGDQDQLASVETGSVLSDICEASHHGESDGSLSVYSNKTQSTLLPLINSQHLMPSQATERVNSVIQDNVVRLIKSHRFDEHSGIGKLAKQIKAGQVAQSHALLNNPSHKDIDWYQPIQSTSHGVADEILKTLMVKLLPIYQQYINALKQGDISQAFNYLYRQQVLCANRTGFWGVQQINGLIENELHKQGLIDTTRDFYIGRPVMLAKNDHQLKVFNGDIGIVAPDPSTPSLNKVWFVSPEGQLRGILPSRLPPLDTLYAMTIHKSQGSEFEAVYLCLPPSRANSGRGLNRELVYTGLTRAKKFFMLFADPKALKLSLAQQCLRGSGLAERLTVQFDAK